MQQGRKIYAFTKSGDLKGQQFAYSLGATWAGGSDQAPPHLLDAAIIFAPVGALIPKALKDLKKGGIVISAGIHISDIPSFPYGILWQERSITSVANLTREDGALFFEETKNKPPKATVCTYSLSQINQALDDLRKGAIKGFAVIDLQQLKKA